jgi:hypothetical protein
MPATINLRTIPGSIERGDRYDAKTLDLFGPSLGQDSATVATVADVRAAVQAFGARLRAAHPDASFMVSVSIRKGDRKPNGYDTGALNNGFGQEDHLRIVDKRTAPAVAAAPSAA